MDEALRPLRGAPVSWPPDPLVYVPYVPGMLRPETEAALAPHNPVHAVLDPEDPAAYWGLLSGVWADGLTFAVVEQDVVPEPGTVEGFAACPQGWCAVPYLWGDLPLTAFGCVRFRDSFIARHPDVFCRIPEAQRDWRSLDSMVIGELHRRGESEHVHGPRALHLRDPEPKAARLAFRGPVRLRWVGDGRRRLDGVPAADTELGDPAMVAIALESGLYVRAGGDDEPRRARATAPEDAPRGGT